jgi:hypothetical protein
MSDEQSTHDHGLIPTAAQATEKVSAYLVPARGAGGAKAIRELFEPDLTHGAMIRCDWDGDPGHLGTFQVKVKGDEDRWVSIGYLEPIDQNVQLVSKSGAVTQVYVRRGPNNPRVPFAVKLVPIKWNIVLTMPEGHGVLVKIGEHYDYDGPAAKDFTWVHSEADDQGNHRVILPNIEGRDYEIWIKLWHPNGSGATQEQDPVIRTGANIPTGPGSPSGT